MEPAPEARSGTGHSLEALVELVRPGLVQHVGVSEVRPPPTRRVSFIANTGVGPTVVLFLHIEVQVEIHGHPVLSHVPVFGACPVELVGCSTTEAVVQCPDSPVTLSKIITRVDRLDAPLPAAWARIGI